MSSKKRGFTDDGWALWLDGDGRSAIYMNDWVNPNGKNHMDISIHIYGIESVQGVNMFIPYEVTGDEITDLSPMLTNVPIFQAMFNTFGIVNPYKTQHISELHYDGRNLNLIHLSEDRIQVQRVSYGTVLSFDIAAIRDQLTGTEVYFTFRVPHKSLNDIFVRKADMLSLFGKLQELLQSPVLSEKFGYSIRINEIRLLPPELHEIRALPLQRIQKAVITLNISDDYELNDFACYRIRRLEADLIHDYVPSGYPCGDIITYQWAEDHIEKPYFNFYFTMMCSRINKTSLAVYLVIVLLLGVMGTVVSDILYWLLGIS